MNTGEYAQMFEVEERGWWYVGMRAISSVLLDATRLQAGERPLLFLDTGCGTGYNLEDLAKRGEAVGVDLSAEALGFCRARGVAVAQASVKALPFRDGSFDCVTSFDVIYHRWITDDRAALLELARVLRPGGLLLVRVPALKLLWGAHDEAVHSRHRYRRKEVVSLLEDAGLVVERATYANTLLFPLLAVRRVFDRLFGRQGSDTGFLPAPLEWSFRRLLLLESRLIAHASLPIGASIFALGRKPR
jgi:SAM-dependent methyltransferase